MKSINYEEMRERCVGVAGLNPEQNENRYEWVYTVTPKNIKDGEVWENTLEIDCLEEEVDELFDAEIKADPSLRNGYELNEVTILVIDLTDHGRLCDLEEEDDE